MFQVFKHLFSPRWTHVGWVFNRSFLFGLPSLAHFWSSYCLLAMLMCRLYWLDLHRLPLTNAWVSVSFAWLCQLQIISEFSLFFIIYWLLCFNFIFSCFFFICVGLHHFKTWFNHYKVFILCCFFFFFFFCFRVGSWDNLCLAKSPGDIF